MSCKINNQKKNNKIIKKNNHFNNFKINIIFF